MSKSDFNRREKIVLIILIFLGFGTLILGFLEIKKNLKEPFIVTSTGETSTLSLKEREELEKLESLMELKNKDSDQDNLSDYDELYLFNTSPYLEDSDSDGFRDKEEIDSGNDPNCPKGKSCGYISPNKSENQTTGSGNTETQSSENNPFGLVSGDNNLIELLNQLSQTQTQIQNQNPTTSTNQNLTPAQEAANKEALKQLQEAFSGGKIPAESLREILREAGMSEEELNKLSDEMLLATFKKTLEQMSGQ